MGSTFFFNIITIWWIQFLKNFSKYSSICKKLCDDTDKNIEQKINFSFTINFPINKTKLIKFQCVYM